MVRLRTLSQAAKLRFKTHLRPVLRQDTRWSSTFCMPGRFFEIREHLDADNEAIEDLLPSPSSTKKLKALLVKMKMVESVSKRIQSSDVTIWEVRALFDALLQQFPVFAKYLDKWSCLFTLARSVELPFFLFLDSSATIVGGPYYKSAVVKLQRGRPLGRQEKTALSVLKVASGRPNADNPDDGFAERVLQRACVSEQTDKYILVAAILLTSSIVERLFSMARAMIGLERHSLQMIMVEAKLFLKVKCLLLGQFLPLHITSHTRHREGDEAFTPGDKVGAYEEDASEADTQNVKPERKGEKLEERLEERTRRRGSRIVTAPITKSFNAELLNTFCDLRLNIASVDVIEGLLIAEIEHIAGSVKNQTLPDIKALLQSKLRLNMTESDLYAGMLDYFNEFGKVMRVNGLTECCSGNDGVREKYKRLVTSLHPATLKSEVKPCVHFTPKFAALNPILLLDLIATEHERQYQRLVTKKKDAPEDKKEKSTAKSEKHTKKKKPWGSNPLSAPFSEAKRTAEMRKSRFVSGTKLRRATETEKDELRKKLRDTNLAKRARLKPLGECLPVPSRTVTLSGVLQLPYCPDSGSDYTTFGSNWVVADKKAKLHLLIHTAAGPVEPISTVAVLIVDIGDDEFIVGNDLLNALGINVDRQLEMLVTVETTRLIPIRSSWKPTTCRPQLVLLNQVMMAFSPPWRD
ncbi:hypothetical protein PC123_g6519 [Phytophthora cactorum]|nr:hypothetical protein PC123_g6519 [Phytophthora cactorum]